MCGRRPLLIRRAIANVAIEHHESWSTSRLLENFQRAFDPLEVIGITNRLHIPAISEESGCNILSEAKIGTTLYGYVVVVIDPAEIVQPKMARQRSRF